MSRRRDPDVDRNGGIGTGVAYQGVDRNSTNYSEPVRTEMSGGAYASQMANVLGQLQSVYGPPGNDGTLESTFSNFTKSLQTLSASPGSRMRRRSAC